MTIFFNEGRVITISLIQVIANLSLLKCVFLYIVETSLAGRNVQGAHFSRGLQDISVII